MLDDNIKIEFEMVHSVVAGSKNRREDTDKNGGKHERTKTSRI